jgi:hypothetical protein
MYIIFKASTREGHVLKTFVEILQHNLKSVIFELSKDNILLRTMNDGRTVLFDLKLNSECFSIFYVKYTNKKSDIIDEKTGKILVGLNLVHFYKMLKQIKKRDSIELFINDENMEELGIKIIPKEKNRTTTSFIKIQHIQSIDTDVPEGYGKPVLIPSGEFQKMCKGLTQISNVTQISAKGFTIKFSSDAGDVMKRCTEFGENDSDEESNIDDDDKEEYKDEYETEQLIKISKIAGLNSFMKIYTKEGLPLLLKSNVGSLGELCIYLKSKKLQDIESHITESN